MGKKRAVVATSKAPDDSSSEDSGDDDHCVSSELPPAAVFDLLTNLSKLGFSVEGKVDKDGRLEFEFSSLGSSPQPKSAVKFREEGLTHSILKGSPPLPPPNSSTVQIPLGELERLLEGGTKPRSSSSHHRKRKELFPVLSTRKR